MYLKNWKSLETSLRTESNYSPASAALPIYLASFLLINAMLIFGFIYTHHVYSVENSNKHISKILINLLESFLSMVFLKAEW